MASEERPEGSVVSQKSRVANLSRRRLMTSGAAIGAGAAAVAANTATVSAGSSTKSRLRSRRQSDSTTLTIVMDGSPSDLNAHSAFDCRSVLATAGAYEGLIGLENDKTDELVGLIAESWALNEDMSIWTFTLRDGVTFQDGTPCDANAVLLNYERLFALALGPIGVLTRFITGWKTRSTAPDAKTIVFTCSKPEPLLPTALASTYAMPIVNAIRMKEHEVDGDWGHIWAQTNAEGTGTGAYKIVSFEPGQLLEMERNDSNWECWEGAQFEGVVTEAATRRQLLEQGERGYRRFLDR